MPGEPTTAEELDASVPEPRDPDIAEPRAPERVVIELARSRMFRELGPLRPTLYRLALRLSGNAALADDLVQETFTRALVRADRFEDGTNLRAWLTTILTRLFLDHVRRSRVIDRAMCGPELESGAEAEPSIALPSDAAVWEAVASLDPQLREVILLRYQREMPYHQIADHLDVPLGTVSSRLRRAHLRLQEILRARDP